MIVTHFGHLRPPGVKIKVNLTIYFQPQRTKVSGSPVILIPHYCHKCNVTQQMNCAEVEKKHWNNLDTWLHFPETSCASKCWASSRPDKLHGGIPESFSLSISSFQSSGLRICFHFIYGVESRGYLSFSSHSSICFTGLLWWLMFQVF